MNDISFSEQSCSSNLLKDESSLHTSIHTLDKIDICGMYSLPSDIGIKHMDGYTVSDYNKRCIWCISANK